MVGWDLFIDCFGGDLPMAVNFERIAQNYSLGGSFCLHSVIEVCFDCLECCLNLFFIHDLKSLLLICFNIGLMKMELEFLHFIMCINSIKMLDIQIFSLFDSIQILRLL